MNTLPKAIQNQIEELKQELKLNKADTDKLIELAKSQYAKSKIVPGEAVGVVAAQSIGEPGTQLTLRTKWLAGATEMTVTQGLPRIIEIVDARRQPTTPTMTIFLKPSYATSEEKVKSIALKILEITLGDIIADMDVDLVRMRIEITLDKEKMDFYGIKESAVQSRIKQLFKTAKITTGSLQINIKPKEEKMDVHQLYRLRVKLKSAYVSGVPGITQVLPVKFGNDWIIRTAGSNLKEVLNMKEVELGNTMTNDIHEIYRVLGVEAARNAIVEEITNVLRNQGIEVDARHLRLVADAMTANGSIQGIGRYGISGEKASILARASFEVPLRHLFNAAIHAERDELKSVVENVMLNQPIPVGTGMVTLRVKKGDEQLGKAKGKK